MLNCGQLYQQRLDNKSPFLVVDYISIHQSFIARPMLEHEKEFKIRNYFLLLLVQTHFTIVTQALASACSTFSITQHNGIKLKLIFN